MLKIELRGDQQVIARFEAMPLAVQRELVKEVTADVQDLEGYIKSAKLSGQVLNRRSGALSRSIHAVLPVTVSGNAVIGTVGQSGDVKYGKIHEFGGKTPPHVIEPKKGTVLAFMWQGKQRFFKKVNHPGSVMPERSFMRSALADKAEQYTHGLKQAALRGMAEKP